jgi:hypothetical protein
MITNIIDERKRPHRYRKVNVVIEATAHDNRCEDADQTDAEGPPYIEYERLSVAEALMLGQMFAGEVTLFLYDEDGGIYAEASK